MLQKIKNTAKRASKLPERKQTISQVSYIIETECSEIQSELEELAVDRLPSPKTKNALKSLGLKVDTLLASAEAKPEEVENYSTLEDLLEFISKLTLQRYSALIMKDQEISPYATFFELLKAFNACPDTRKASIEEVYKLAVRSMLTHKQFESSLLKSFSTKVKILGIGGDHSTNQERKRVEEFICNYGEFRKLNPNLLKNEPLEVMVSELEAIIYLQTQLEVLASGDVAPTLELVDFIDYWAEYLSGLSAEEQEKRLVFFDVVEDIGEINNVLVERLIELEQAHEYVG